MLCALGTHLFAFSQLFVEVNRCWVRWPPPFSCVSAGSNSYAFTRKIIILYFYKLQVKSTSSTPNVCLKVEWVCPLFEFRSHLLVGKFLLKRMHFSGNFFLISGIMFIVKKRFFAIDILVGNKERFHHTQ